MSTCLCVCLPVCTCVQEADKVREEGILMFAVGVGDGVDQRELAQIATKNSHQFVHTVRNFPGLSSISVLLALQACQGPASRCYCSW